MESLLLKIRWTWKLKNIQLCSVVTTKFTQFFKQKSRKYFIILKKTSPCWGQSRPLWQSMVFWFTDQDSKCWCYKITPKTWIHFTWTSTCQGQNNYKKILQADLLSHMFLAEDEKQKKLEKLQLLFVMNARN